MTFPQLFHSFGYNDYWTKNNSGINGQPSLIYHAQITAGEPCHVKLRFKKFGMYLLSMLDYSDVIDERLRKMDLQTGTAC